MSIPKNLQAKYLKKFEDLDAEGLLILSGTQIIPGKSHVSFTTGRTFQTSEKHKIDQNAFYRWRTSAVSLLDVVIPKNSVHRTTVTKFLDINPEKYWLEWGISILSGAKKEFEGGFFSDLAQVIEAEIASDYMGQAEQLLTEGQSGKYDHIPAAVLTGAILEKHLRTLATKNNPPIDLLNSKGERKSMNPLIDDLKKAGILLETKAKELRGWAGIRNDAAHGDFDKFKREDVELMLKGVQNFIANF